MSDPAHRQLQRITALIALERRVRQARNAEELGFLMVNDTHGLIPYRQAALWRGRNRTVAALSGLVQPDANAPFVGWLGRLCRHLDESGQARGTVQALTAADVPADLAADWGEWLPGHTLWVPLLDPLAPGPERNRLGGLLLARDEPWSEADRTLIDYVASAYGHAWARHLTAGWSSGRGGLGGRIRSRPRLWTGAFALVLTGAALMPVRLSVLAPAEVTAAAPMVVRAPVDGVVDRIAVRPDDPVREGNLLVTLDSTRLQSRLEVASKSQEMAEAELRQAQQQALFDNRAKAQLALLQGKRDQHAAEAAYVASLLQRIEIKAPRAGVALFDDVNDWIGKPVVVGERIMMVADPREVELDIRLPVKDAIALDEGAEVLLFLNIDPDRPVGARLTSAAYRAQPAPDGTLAYRLKAAFGPASTDPGDRLRIGLKGVAKVYGRDVSLFHYLFRRPLAIARQWLRW